jgi:hypothetical protein
VKTQKQQSILPIDLESDPSHYIIKKCIHCEKEKPLCEFQSDRGSWHPLCIKCHRRMGKVNAKVRKTAPPMPLLCDCCGKSAKDRPRGKLCMDHDHDTEQFRGWICDRCNIGIGKLGDSIEGVMNALRYLQRFNRKSNDLSTL